MRNIFLAGVVLVASIGVAHAAGPRPNWYILNASTYTCVQASALGYPFDNPYNLRMYARLKPDYGGTKIYRHANGSLIGAIISTQNKELFYTVNLATCQQVVADAHLKNLNDLK
ncbi:MAG: hypothetical protein PHZ23_14660 [Acidiphilium sp.]|nr:hypothetical protein [Acidiphilium sp.]